MKIPLALTFVLFLTLPACADDIAYAKDLYRHGLIPQAVEAFIKIYYAKDSLTEPKADSLYFLGQILFQQGKYSAALEDWNRLVSEFPSSQRAGEIKGRLEQLSGVFAKSSDSTVSSSIATSFIRNGDFFMGTDLTFHLDTSWLPMDQLATQWYDRVLSEFQGTDAAALAFERKLFALIGWTTQGQYPERYGAKKNFAAYMPRILETFSQFESAFPQSPKLQAFRYQIAQLYWDKKDWDNTTKWLNKIIEVDKGKETFYSGLAKARLAKVKY